MRLSKHISQSSILNLGHSINVDLLKDALYPDMDHKYNTGLVHFLHQGESLCILRFCIVILVVIQSSYSVSDIEKSIK